SIRADSLSHSRKPLPAVIPPIGGAGGAGGASGDGSGISLLRSANMNPTAATSKPRRIVIPRFIHSFKLLARGFISSFFYRRSTRSSRPPDARRHAVKPDLGAADADHRLNEALR